MALTHHVPLRSSMSNFDNIKKAGKTFSKRDYLRNRAVHEHNEQVLRDLSARREEMFKKRHDITGMKVALIRRTKNIGKDTVFNVSGLGNIVGSLADAKESARLAGKTHWKSGAILGKL